MPITVKHTKVSTIPDDADTSLVRPSDWNADHTLVGLGTMAEQNANAVAITGGTGTFTSVTTQIVQATNSAGLALRNSAGTTQISMGAGGGDNITVSVPIAITPANALVNISPTGTGTVTINPATAGTINNMAIGATTRAAGSFTSLTTTNAPTFGAALPIASGGTNATATPTAGTVAYGTGTAYAFTAVGTAGQVLQSNGSSAPSWAAAPAAAAGGSNTQIQFNNSGVLAGNSTYTMVSSVMKENGFNFVSQADVGYNPNQIPLNQYLGKLAFQDLAQRNLESSLATSAGLTAVTAVTGSLTLATGGVTLANQLMAVGSVWRIRAYGTYQAISSAVARTLTMRCYWGSTALTAVTTGNVLASTAQTFPWSVEFVITGSSATAVWVTGILSSQVTSATIPQDNIATAASVTGLTTNSTLDFQVGQTGTATADTINVHSVTMERIK